MREGHGSEQVGQAARSLRPNSIKDNDEGRVDEDGERNGGVLEVVEMVGRNGAIEVEWLVLLGANKKLHGDRGCTARHDEGELGVSKLGRWEP